MIFLSLIVKEELKLFELEKKIIFVGKKFDFKLYDNEYEKKVKDKFFRFFLMSFSLGFKFYYGFFLVVFNKFVFINKMLVFFFLILFRLRLEIKIFVSVYCLLIFKSIILFSYIVFVDKIVIVLLKNRCLLKCN